ncbi:MAG: hypothetical protein AB8H86_30500 [Polyangiales bacterium]
MRHLFLIALLCVFGCEGLETKVAEPCLTSEECVEGSLCFDVPGAVALCMETCEADTRLCEGGEVCIAVASDMENVCYLGGSVAPGNGCIDSSVCEAGGVCIQEGDVAVCRVACDTRNPSCPTPGDTCEELSFPAGFCAPMPATPMEE